jgi:hypothetical protein
MAIITGGIVAGAGAGLAGYLLLFAVHVWAMLAYAYPLDYGEGPLLAQAEMLRGGTSLWHLYRDPATPPYTVVNYPPLYPLVVAVGGWISGQPLLAGRLISLAAAVGCVGALVALSAPALAAPDAQRTARTGRARWFVALFFLTIPVVREWAVLLRVDMVGVCLGLWGLVALQRGRVGPAALLLLLALYTKPSLIAAPLAGVVWVGWGAIRARSTPDGKQQWSIAHILLLVGVMAGVGGAVLLLMQWASGGWFLHHVVTANANRWEGDLAWRFWIAQAQLRWPLLLAAAVGVWWAGRRGMDTTLPVLYTLAAMVTALGVGKVGAYANYFLEWYAGVLWLVCVGVSAGGAGHSPPRRPAPVPALLLLLLLSSLVYYPPMWSKQTLYRAGLVEPNPPRLAFGRYAIWEDQRREGEVLAALARVYAALERETVAAGGAIFTDMPGVAAGAGVGSRMQVFEHRQLLDQGAWDQRPLLRDLANGAVPLAVIDYMGNWMPSESIALLEQRYALDGTIGMFDLYRPVAPGPRIATALPFPPALTLTAYHLNTTAGHSSPLTVSPGALLIVTLEWERQTTPATPDAAAPVQVVLHLRDEAGQAVLEHTRPLFAGALAPADLPPGQAVQHMHPFRLPPDLPPGAYHLALSLRYDDHAAPDPAPLTRIAVAAGGEHSTDTGYVVPAPFVAAREALGGAARVGLPLMPAVPFAWGRLQCFEYTCLEERGGGVVQRPVGALLYLAETLRSDTCMTAAPSASSSRRLPASSPLLPPCPGFLPFWQRLGPDNLGTAISGEVLRNGYIVQWTQYARLEQLPDSDAVGVGRLGAETLQLAPGERYRWPRE